MVECSFTSQVVLGSSPVAVTLKGYKDFFAKVGWGGVGWGGVGWGGVGWGGGGGIGGSPYEGVRFAFH